jgi:mono/diheme cytochrome c family protein
MHKLNFYIGFLVFAAMLVGLFWWYSESGGAVSANADDPALVARGELIYAENCAACHGKNLEGQPDWRQRKPDGRLPAPPHDDTGHTWHHADQQLFQITKRGIGAIAGPDYKTDMMAFDSVLSDPEIWAVLSFIKSHWSKRIRRRNEEINARPK